MSRIVDNLCARFLISSSVDVEPDEQERMVKWLKPEIERLLAEERVRGGDAIVELTKKYGALLSTEREKVREMCARVVCFRCAEGNKPFDNGITWLHLLERKISEPTRESWNEDCEAAPIRQLDLTKLDEEDT